MHDRFQRCIFPIGWFEFSETRFIGLFSSPSYGEGEGDLTEVENDAESSKILQLY